MATSMQEVVGMAVAEASDGLQPWAGVRGGGGRVIDKWNHRSRPQSISASCRSCYGTDGVPALVLLTQSLGNPKRVAMIITFAYTHVGLRFTIIFMLETQDH